MRNSKIWVTVDVDGERKGGSFLFAFDEIFSYAQGFADAVMGDARTLTVRAEFSDSREPAEFAFDVRTREQMAADYWNNRLGAVQS